MDYQVIAAERLINAQEDAADAACNRAAEQHGVLDRAHECEDCELKCPGCPWKHSTH